MTFNPVAAQNIIECIKIIKENKPKAIDLGSQTPSLSNAFLDFVIKNNKFLDSSQISMINDLKKNKNFSTKDFFKSIGYSDYYSIDINGAYKSYKFDLNKDINDKYNFKETFDLVINNGTGEHVFNQYLLFLNLHNITKKGGLMLNILPFVDWINHGFYNFNPIFFADLAASNSYKILKIALANRNGAEIVLKEADQSILFEQIKPNRAATKFKNLLDFAKEKLGINILLVVITQKNSNKKFKTPLQGKYLEDVSGFSTDYEDQNPGSANAENQIPDNLKRK
jgi:hypothetical protein